MGFPRDGRFARKTGKGQIGNRERRGKPAHYRGCKSPTGKPSAFEWTCPPPLQEAGDGDAAAHLDYIRLARAQSLMSSEAESLFRWDIYRLTPTGTAASPSP